MNSLPQPPPYDGVSAVMSRAEAEEILRRAPDIPGRKVMLGVLASANSLAGVFNRPNRYPPKERFAEIFPEDPRALNLVHYYGDPRGMLLQIPEIVRLAGRNLHGFQLNVAWPAPVILKKITERYPLLTMVLQVNRTAFSQVNCSAGELADRVAQYDGAIDYVLLDASGGEGKLLNPLALRRYLSKLALRNLPVGLGVAGGLSAETVDVLAPLFAEFPGISVDAEHLLRNHADDTLSLEKAERFLNAVHSLRTQCAAA